MHILFQAGIKDIIKTVFEIPGWKTNRKIIVLISDDWGGVRIKSKEARENLIRCGIDMNSNRFDRYDTLESNKDLEYLFEILVSYKDCCGNHPVITAACNVANPDFKKIRDSGYKEYYYEPFTETLKHYPDHDKVYELYNTGIGLKIFHPEFHGREHLNIKLWLDNLKAGNELLIKSFDQEFWHLPGKYLLQSSHRSLGAAFDFESSDEIPWHKETVFNGVALFRQIFNYLPCLLVPPSQYFHKNLEQAIELAGCRMIDVPRLRKMPIGSGKFQTKVHFLGQKNKAGLRYLIRDAVFEPNLNDNSDGVQECLKGIGAAFRYKKPAIISNHRASFTGGIDIKNRDKGLRALKLLLNEILKRWPDAEFISAASLHKMIEEN